MENEEFCDSLARSSSTQSKAMAAPAASLLSLRCPSSPFKHSNKKRPLVIINQAAAAAASVVTKSPGTRFRLDNLGPQPWSRKKERAVSLICVELLEEVLMHNDSLETLEEKGLINPSGRERTLPLKVLGDGELSAKLNIKARSAAAAAKNLTRAEEYFAEKRAAAAASEPTAA
ncbi:hypothetical protein OIU76_011707 [Salix suchowensis]|nr:hypothetical protein OIU76_011707 [Salix suchowensis]